MPLNLSRSDWEGIALQPSQKLTPEQREEVFLLLDEGISLRETARRFGVDPRIAEAARQTA